MGYSSLCGLNDAAGGLFVAGSSESDDEDDDDLMRAGTETSVGQKEKLELGTTFAGRFIVEELGGCD